MKKFSSSKIKLSEYLEAQAQMPYFSLLPERYLLARELLNTYNDQLKDSKGGMSCIAPFLNLESVELESIEPEEDDSVQVYCVKLPETSPSDKSPYSNYAFGNTRLFKTKGMLGKLHDSSNEDVNALLNKDPSYSVHTLATIAFYIYFGVHPLCGREYYESLDTSSEYDKGFFEKERKFIFELKDNPNRFVNGYHSNVWTLWNNLLDCQRDFWSKAFGGGYKSYSEFYSEWHKCYGSFTISNVQTECLAKLKAIIFNENYALITSDNTIGNKTIRCRGCNNSLAQKCEDCQIPSEKRNANLLIINAKVAAVGTPASATEEKKLALHDGRVVSAKDFVEGGDDKAIFEVIASKKNNLLGLKYLLDEPITVTCGSQEKKYSKDAVIPLLSGVHVQVLDGYEIITPGQPVEPKPAPKPAKPAEPAKPADSQKSAEPVIITAPTIPVDITKTTKTSIPAVPQAPASTPTSTPTQSSVPASLPEGTVVMLENGERCTVKKLVQSAKMYEVYDVTMIETQVNCRLKIFRKATPEEAITRNDIINNIKATMQLRGSFHPSILYPQAIVDSTGALEGRAGYISPKIPAGMLQLEYMLNRGIDFNSKQAMVNAMIELCQMLESLREKGLMHKYVNPYSIYVDTKSGKCCLVLNEYISSSKSIASTLPVFVPFSDPVSYTSQEVNSKSDTYSAAVMMFLMAFKMLPFDNCRYAERPKLSNDEASRDEIIKRYVTSPEFCFGDKMSFNSNTQCNADGNITADYDDKIKNIRNMWYSTDYNIRELFEQTFEAGVKKPDQRPNLQQWISRLEKWQSNLQSK